MRSRSDQGACATRLPGAHRSKLLLPIIAWIVRLFGLAELDDQVEACRRIFESDARWTVVRCSDLEEGPSEGLPVWSAHVGDPVLKSNLTRRIDFALFMVEALGDESLVREAPAIVGCKSPSALAHASRQLGGAARLAGRSAV